MYSMKPMKRQTNMTKTNHSIFDIQKEEKGTSATIILTPNIVANAPQMTNIRFGDIFFLGA